MSYRVVLLCLCAALFWSEVTASFKKTWPITQVTNETIYTTLCCVIGDWMEGWIIQSFEQLKDILMFYKPNKINPKFQYLLMKAIGLLLSEVYIINNAKTLLDKVLWLYPSSAYYSNLTVFRTLTMLQIKLPLIEHLGKNMFKTSPISIIQSILEEHYAVQYYLVGNCRRLQKDSIQTPYVRSEDRSSNVVNSFITVVNTQFPIINQPGCEIKQLFLSNIVTLPPESIFARIILNSMFHVNEKISVRIYDLLNISLRINSEYIYMYQEVVLMATMKYIYNSTAIYSILAYLYYKKYVQNLIIAIHLEISKNPKMFPELLVDGITLFNSILCEPNYHQLPEHISYIKRLDSVHLYEESNFEKFLIVFTNKLPLLKLLNQILNNLDDFKCIHNSVKYRRIEYEKYHHNFLEIKNNFNSGHPTDEFSHYESADVCKFVLNIILSCNTVLYSNNLEFTKKFLLILTEYMLILLYGEIKNNKFNKTLVNIAIILINLPMENEMYHAKKAINVIIIQMNIFGTKYCNPSEFKFWYHFILEPNNNGDNTFVHGFINNIYQTINKPKDLTKFTKSDAEFEHMNIDHLNKTFIETSVALIAYGKNVKFFWKWKETNINKVFEDGGIFYSDDLYALYDMYFKFYIAMIFYTFKQFYNKSTDNIESKLKTVALNLNSFDADKFPSKLNYLIKDIQQIIQMHSHGSSIDLNEIIIRIDKNLIRNGIRFEALPTLNENDNKLLASGTKIILQVINKELEDKVQKVNQLFSKLQLYVNIEN